MIIVEGPDGAGKTTLVNYLLEVFGDDLVLGERGTKNRDDLWKVTKPDTYRAIHRSLGYPGRDLEVPQVPEIWDRLFWSEFVYWDLVGRDKPEFNQHDQTLIPQVIAALDSLVIWCLPPRSVVMANIESEAHQMEGVRERSAQIFDRYSGMMLDRELVPGTLRNKFFVYDYTGTRISSRSLYEIKRAVSQIIERWGRRLG
jgi:hypothetical protein